MRMLAGRAPARNGRDVDPCICDLHLQASSHTHQPRQPLWINIEPSILNVFAKTHVATSWSFDTTDIAMSPYETRTRRDPAVSTQRLVYQMRHGAVHEHLSRPQFSPTPAANLMQASLTFAGTHNGLLPLQLLFRSPAAPLLQSRTSSNKQPTRYRNRPLRLGHNSEYSLYLGGVIRPVPLQTLRSIAGPLL
jgi:hypothetical protein